MPVAVRLDIDLTFSVAGAEGERGMTGTVTAAGSEIDIAVSDPALVLGSGGGRRSLATVRHAAVELARRGVTVSLSGPDGVLVRIGAVRAPLADRVLTGSKHIRITSVGALMGLLRTRSAAPSAVFPPPATLLPLAPTVERNPHTHITTTHYTPGSGRPRLIFVMGSETWNGQPPREFELRGGVTTIGSGPQCDLRLDDLEPVHAEIRHDANDEYVLHMLAADRGGFPVLDPAPGRDRVLRTGARIELGEWRMAFFREEFADHGRPFGGRAGGEFARQRAQPPRHHDASPPSRAT